MHLLSNAPHYEELHELGHFEHWSSKTLDGHFTDFADDAADIMGNAARSRGLTLNANIAGKQKGIDYHLDEHIPELIEKADKGLVEYWRKELHRLIDEMEGWGRRLSKSDEVTSQASKYRERLEDILNKRLRDLENGNGQRL